MSNGQPTNRMVKEWMEDIRRGRIALPRFQRKFVWNDKTISKLIFSIIRKNPIGTLLLFRYNSEYKLFKPYPIEGAENHFDEKHCDRIILDGQQRLTAIWCALNNSFPEELNKKREFFMKIDLEDEWDLVKQIECRKINNTDNKKLDKERYFFNKNLIPIKLLSAESRFKIKPWIEKMCEDSDRSDNLYSKIDKLNEEFNKRDISYHIIPEEENSKNIDAKEVIDIFITINTSSIKMKQLEIAIALIEGEDIKDGLWGRFRDKIAEIEIEKERMERFFPSKERIYKLEELILKIACLLTKKKNGVGGEESISLAPKQSNYTDSNVVMTVIDKWDNIVRAIDQTLKFLEDESIYNEKRLPSEVPLRVLPALFANIPKKIKPDNKGQIDELIRSYLWRSFVTDRYDSTAETRLHQDYVEMYKAIEKMKRGDFSDQYTAHIFNNENYRIPDRENLFNLDKFLKTPKGTSKRGSSKLSRALLILSLKKGAKDIASGEKINSSNIRYREEHHLFPKQMLHNEGKNESQIDHPLNIALILSTSNKIIAAKKPKDYLSQRMVGNTKEGDVRKRVESHLIPYDELNVETGEGGNYERFIEKRAELFEAALKELCEGKEWP